MEVTLNRVNCSELLNSDFRLFFFFFPQMYEIITIYLDYNANHYFKYDRFILYSLHDDLKYLED